MQLQSTLTSHKSGISPDSSQKTSVAYLTEVFSGIQGEGPLVGHRQIFVRFTGCDLRCQWCDTPASLTVRERQTANIEITPGERDFELLQNPVSLDSLAEALVTLEKSVAHHSVSFTGGEPLLQADFLGELISKLKHEYGFKPRIYLETGGHRPLELARIISFVDYISFDLKLPSSTADKVLWKEHQDFIQVAKVKEGYAKAVLTAETSDADLEKACEIMQESLSNFELVIQPAYKLSEKVKYGVPSPEQMLRWHALAIQKLGRGRVRVIPQTHKFIGQL